MKIKTTIDGISYQLQQGVVLGDNFLNRQDFELAFKEMLNNSDGYARLRYNLAQTQKITSIIQKNNKIQTITEFTSNLEQISQIFSSFMMGLGGNISLLTTFNLGKKNQQTYFLMDENDLPSQLNAAGEKLYLNTKEDLKKVQLRADKLQLLNKALKSHLSGFYRQLTSSSTQTIEEYERMRVWSYYNMPERYKIFEQRDEHHPVSIGRYFWGKGHTQGYAAEAYGAHLAMIHPDVFMGEHISNLKRSVISEHGGPGSYDLFNLLNSTKGNISSQLSGDIVVIDNNGKVKFNIQSKASKYGAYSFTITYQQFLQKMILFLDIYDKYVDNMSVIEKQDIDALFNAFSTNAWVPISKELANDIDQEVDETLKNFFK